MRLFYMAVLAAGLAILNATGARALTLTDSTVFSTNQFGETWLGWIWNTQGSGTDGPNRWNMYYSSSSDPASPVFINSGNDSSAEIAIDLVAGVYDFIIYGQQTGGPTDDPALHFVANLYFDGHTAAADISGITGPDCPGVCAASHPNGLDRFGNDMTPEAGTLSYTSGNTTATLTRFSWTASGDVNEVWEHWAGDYNGSNTSGPDFIGRLQLTVEVVPLPGSAWLIVAGIGALAAGRRRSAH